MNFGIIGCGRVSKKHIDAISANKDAVLVAVCDIDPYKAKTVGQELFVPYYTSYDKMLCQENIDVINILTPSGDHAKHVIDIVSKYQVHIICEKPMALTLLDADAMIEVCNKNNTRLFIVKQNRFNKPVQLLKKTIDSGILGDIYIATVRVRWSRSQQYYDQATWRGKWASDGGVISNQASHHIDLLQWVLGKPIAVMGKMATYCANIEVDDTAFAIIDFENGATGIVEATTATNTNLEGSLSIIAEKGTIVIGGFGVNKIITWDVLGQNVGDVSQYSENPPNEYGYGHIHYINDVIQNIIKGTPALVSGYEGRKTLELTTAIYESAVTQKRVFIGSKYPYCPLGKTNDI